MRPQWSLAFVLIWEHGAGAGQPLALMLLFLRPYELSVLPIKRSQHLLIQCQHQLTSVTAKSLVPSPHGSRSQGDEILSLPCIRRHLEDILAVGRLPAAPRCRYCMFPVTP